MPVQVTTISLDTPSRRLLERIAKALEDQNKTTARNSRTTNRSEVEEFHDNLTNARVRHVLSVETGSFEKADIIMIELQKAGILF